MSRDPLLLSPAHTIREVAGMFLARRIDGAPVVDERGELLGLFTKSHIMRAMHEGIDPLTPVADLMTRDHLVTVSPEDTVEEFLQMMMDVPAVDADNPFHMLVAQDYPASRPVGRVPVVEEGRVVGMATRSDLARAFLDLLNSVSNELETIVNSVHNPIISIDRSGDIRLFNRAAERLLGRKMETVMGKNVKAFFPTTRLLETLRTGVAEYSQGIEIDGKHFLSNRSPMIRDGQIIGAVAVLQDVTELEAVYRQLQQSNRINTELDAIIESSFDGLFVTDAHAVVLRMNKAFERIYGFDRQELLGRNMYDLVQEGYFSESVSLLVLQRQEPVTIVQQNIRGKTTLVTGNPVYNEDGEIFRVVTNVRDISELNELKHKLEQAQSLSDHYATQLQQLRMKLLEEQRMIVNSAKMEHLLQMALRLARVDTTVLILGESGVGKELIAETIHNNSDRRDQAFIRINCAAIPETLLESELFGYEGGAFTGDRKEG
jgi:PAS domain S-box-containing protein